MSYSSSRTISSTSSAFTSNSFRAPAIGEIQRLKNIMVAAASSSFANLLPTTPTKRTMVTVTQTKASEIVPDVAVVDNSTTLPTMYKTQSEALLVTESCLKRVEQLIQQRQQQQNQENESQNAASYFLRVFVDAGGCSGFQYQFEIDSELDEDDDVVLVVATETGDAADAAAAAAPEPRVVVDETSLGFLEGSTLDYVVEMIKSSFAITNNPKSESACGCGSSFAVKNFEANPALD